MRITTSEHGWWDRTCGFPVFGFRQRSPSSHPQTQNAQLAYVRGRATGQRGVSSRVRWRSTIPASSRVVMFLGWSVRQRVSFMRAEG